jgi:hypothetical protein
MITPNTGNIDYSGSSPLVLLRPAWEKLFEIARAQAKEGQYQLAVVFSHAACELQIEGAVNQLLNARSDKVLVKLVSPANLDTMSLDSDRVYRVYAALTNDHPKEADWWKEWMKSRQDRHAVAHKGLTMTEQQANAAIASAQKHLDHVSKAVAVALATPVT